MFTRILTKLQDLPAPFRWYLVVLVLVYTADSIMAYAAPVIITQQVKDTVITGVIMAMSSLTGMLVDFLFAKSFVHKKHQFFLRILLSLTLFFPFSLLVWQVVPSLIFAMVIWGVYFEAIVFSNHHAVHEFLPPEQHVRGWGIIAFIRSVSLIIGPLLASSYGGSTMLTPLLIATGLFVAAIVVFTISKRLMNWYGRAHFEEVDTHGFRQELRIWKTFSRRLWPLLGLVILYYLIESAFFSVVPLYSESLKQISPFGGWIVSVYCVPGLVLGAIAGWLAKPFGKKFIAYLGALIGGVGLIILSHQTEIPLILATTLGASVGLGMIFPEIMSVFENYVARVHKVGNDLIGLTALCGSAAYVLGPILNGWLYQMLGMSSVFRFWGILLTVYAVLLILIVPRKVKMPQEELAVAAANSK